MEYDWYDLSAILARHDYKFQPGELHYGATEPRDAPTCRCDQPGYHDDDGEVRCWKCGACRATATA
jgi:hypothetical protein